jgi:hypothetical protein
MQFLQAQTSAGQSNALVDTYIANQVLQVTTIRYGSSTGQLKTISSPLQLMEASGSGTHYPFLPTTLDL